MKKTILLPFALMIGLPLWAGAQCGSSSLANQLHLDYGSYVVRDMALYTEQQVDENFEGCLVLENGDHLITTGTFRYNGVPKIYYTTPCHLNLDSASIFNNTEDAVFSYQDDLQDQSISTGSAITADNDGRIYVVGTWFSDDFSSSHALFMANGGMTSFGGIYAPVIWDTILGIGPSSGGTAVATDNNGRAFVVGTYYDSETYSQRAFIASFSDLFTPFASFDGIWPLDFESTSSGEYERTLILYGIKVQPDGKPVMVGVYYDESSGNDTRMIAMRLNTDLSFDNTFGNNGVAILHPPSAPLRDRSMACALDLQPDGKIVLVGTSGFYDSEEHSFTAVRLNTNGTPDNTFGQGGYAIHTMYNPTAQDPDLYYPDEFESYIARTVKVLPNGNLAIGGGFLYLGGLEDFATLSPGTDTYGGHAAVLVLSPQGQAILNGAMLPVGFDNLNHLSRMYSPDMQGSDIIEPSTMLADIELINGWSGTEVYRIVGAGGHQEFNTTANATTNSGFIWCISSDEGTVTQTTDELPETGGLTLYPNPNPGNFVIEFPAEGSYTVEMFNLMGQPVYTAVETGADHSVSLGSIPAGIYSVRVISPNWSHSKAVIIE